jgi:serine/threonine-protein kinase HipA
MIEFQVAEDTGPVATIAALLSVIPYFQISAERAREIFLKMEHALSGWRETGLALGMTEHELDQFSEAFEHSEREAARRAATRVD